MAHEFEVQPVDDGRPLHRVVEGLEGGLPAALVRRLIRQRRVKVNGRRTRDAALRVHAGDRLEIHHDFREPGDDADPRRWSGPEPDVLHQDGDWLVVSKPAGVACSDDGTDPLALAVWLRERLADEIRAGRARPEPCHRLDRGTTGIVVVALHPAASDLFRRALADGRITKDYEVVVEGIPGWESMRCEAALRRRENARRDEPRMEPGPDLSARTDFQRRATGDGCALLAARPVTGRTHQIRAHCLHLGFPVVGDSRYGSGSAVAGVEHQLLHARRLHLDGPGGFRVEAPWPAAEAAALLRLGLSP